MLDPSVPERRRTEKDRRSWTRTQWRGLHRDMYEYNVRTRPAALFQRKIMQFFIDRWKFTGLISWQSRKPCSSARRATYKKNRYCAFAHSRSNECNPLLVQAVSARAVEPKRPTGTAPGLFPPSITGDPRADTNRAKIKDALANVEPRSTSGPRKRARCITNARGSSMCAGRRQVLQVFFFLQQYTLQHISLLRLRVLSRA